MHKAAPVFRTFMITHLGRPSAVRTSRPRSLPLPPVAATGRVDRQPTLVGSFAVVCRRTAAASASRGSAVAAGMTPAASAAPSVSRRFVGGVVAFVHVINIISDRTTTGIVAVVLASSWTAAPSSTAAAPHRTAARSSAAVHVRIVAAIVPPTHRQALHRTQRRSVDAAQLLVDLQLLLPQLLHFLQKKKQLIVTISIEQKLNVNRARVGCDL
jgi:hypothetical protein